MAERGGLNIVMKMYDGDMSNHELFAAISDMLAVIVDNMATKEELSRCATKDDLKRFATKEDVRQMIIESESRTQVKITKAIQASETRLEGRLGKKIDDLDLQHRALREGIARAVAGA